MEVVFRNQFGFLQPNELQAGLYYRGQLKTVALHGQIGLYRQTAKIFESADGGSKRAPQT